MDSASLSASNVMTTSPDTFIKLCLLWTAIHRTNVLPGICKKVIPEDDVAKLRSQVDLAKVWGSLNNKQRSAYYRPSDRNIDRHRENHIQFHYRYTSKSLSILGVLGGVILILLVIAMSTCIRNRRRMLLEEQENHAHENFAREILISHLRQLRGGNRSNNNSLRRHDTPPSYDDLVKTEEERQQQLSASSSATSCANPNAVIPEECLEMQEPPSYIEALEAEANMAVASAGEEHVVTIEVRNEEEEDKVAKEESKED